MIEAAKDPKMLEKLRHAQQITGTPHDQLLTQKQAQEFAKLSFATQYAEGIEQAGEITPELRAQTQGKWVTYQKGTDPTALWASLQNRGTAWCTKGFATAETQLKGGDFHVYYTNDSQGKPTIPRIAIRMQGDSIGEVRGVADNDQNMEGNMADIAEAKMREFPGLEKYKKVSGDMKTLTAIEKKTKRGENLTKDDLTFLYELNASIQGFGYQKDPRIQELRAKRNTEEDMLIILECTREQIAKNPKEINQTTKAYVGPLEPNIFALLQQYNIEHVYTSFPEGKIRQLNLEIGGKSAKKLEQALKQANINVYDTAKELIKHKDFTTAKKRELLQLIRLTVKDLGFPNGATTEDIYAKAQELGLELVPPEVGPHLRLNYTDQPLGEWLVVGMKPITGSDGGPRVFDVHRGPGGPWLGTYWAEPADHWHPQVHFVFRLRKPR